ncbi:unnamed protein product, partial [Mesorhabditis belari]|uniref:NAD-dependent protein deacylase n=1 Tax=Mesorhabditis belari TaxID=2138241 RepID=A0AAF3EEI7_9BILA
MFIPAHKAINEGSIDLLLKTLSQIDKLVVLTGAGISTESGIPDYRSPKVGAYARSNHRPMYLQEFLKSHHARQRFWARNFLAWPRFRDAHPNVTHQTIASWERSDRFHWLITQNVDGLHAKAGSERMTELHGCGHRVKCFECKNVIDREELQERLTELNPKWTSKMSPGEIRPDGDIQIEADAEKEFKLANCEECNGILKTDVIFFGENVPLCDVQQCHKKIDECDGVLVLGSSLQVMSGYRFAHQAVMNRKIPLIVVNIGPTRVDKIATLKIEGKCSDVIARI